MTTLSAVMVVGPRAAGKTTSARRLTQSVLRLDRPAEAAVVAADPDTALRRTPEPVLIDEWQEVPTILGAVKRAVDDDPRPGRFVLTGSVVAGSSTSMWPGTGRLITVPLRGLTRREMARDLDATDLLSLVLDGDLSSLRLPGVAPDIDSYLRLASQGGFPEVVLRLDAATGYLWLDSYLDQVVTRDAKAVGEAADPQRLRRYLEVLGLSTAGLPAETTLAEAAQLNVRTVRAYDRLLSRLYLLDLTPAWETNRLSRLLKRPKRYLTDPALALAAARIGVEDVLSDADLLGRLLDTLVVSQLLPELELRWPRARLHHVRTESGRQEVDLLIDLGGGRIIAAEVKATAAPSPKDARHLIWLRDELGAAFVRGIVFHTGPQPFELGDRLWALPIASLWA